jgi:hypothetical protein
LLFRREAGPASYLVAHENPDLPHDDPPPDPMPPMTDIFFSVIKDPHDGHGGFFRSLTGTSSSKSLPQSAHLYS